jgi:hypothetical protein
MPSDTESRWIDALAHALASPVQIIFLLVVAVVAGIWFALPIAIACGVLSARRVRTLIEIRERAELIRQFRARYAELRP